MFGRSKQRDAIADAIEAALTPVMGKLSAAETALAAVQDQMRQRATLIDIQQDGRTLIFVFARNGTLIKIETMGMLSADVPGWKRALLEPLP